MTALRFQTGGGGTSDIPGLPSGEMEERGHPREKGGDTQDGRESIPTNVGR